MKRTEYMSVGDVLRLAIEENNMQGRLNEARACRLWKEIVGTEIASRTGTPSMKEGVMTIAVPDASLRHELSMSRTGLARCLNSAIGAETVISLRFISSPSRLNRF